MTTEPGLRERKKQRTYSAISDAAIALFLERGYENVSITQIAEAAEVSRRTLFAYFPAKEDLVLHRIADHEAEAARVVRDRPGDVAPLTALRAHFLDGLRRRDPVTGLNDVPVIGAFYRLVFGTPDLLARLQGFRGTGERELGDALRETAGLPDVTARLAAAQLVAVQWTLAHDNMERLAAGESADDRYPGAVADAEHAYTLVRDGLGDLAPVRLPRTLNPRRRAAMIWGLPGASPSSTKAISADGVRSLSCSCRSPMPDTAPLPFRPAGMDPGGATRREGATTAAAAARSWRATAANRDAIAQARRAYDEEHADTELR